MNFLRGGLRLSLLAASSAFAGAPDQDVVRVANWLVGSFNTRAQVEARRAMGGTNTQEVALMTARPLQDPVAFTDGLYIYVEARIEGAPGPPQQHVYRLKKSGSRVRMELLRIDGQVLAPLASEAQMLNNLAPGDLTKESGCDVLLEANALEYVGSTTSRSCKSTPKGSAYRTTSIRVAENLTVILERGYDEKGVQTFGPSDGRGYEFRKTLP